MKQTASWKLTTVI